MPLEFINQNILLIGLVVMSGGALLWQLFGGAGVNGVNPVEATLLINREDAHVVDVRETEEFANGHLPDARHIPLSKLADRVGEIEKFKGKLKGMAVLASPLMPIDLANLPRGVTRRTDEDLKRLEETVMFALIERSESRNLELTRKVIDEVRRLKMQRHVVIQSFSPIICAIVKAEAAGISMIVDPYGRIVAQNELPAGIANALVADVPLGTGDTPYTRLSDWMGWVTLVGMVGFSMVTGRKPKVG